MVIVLTMLGWLTGTGQCRTYRIATVAWMGWSPLHVAAEQGFWKQQGLDVQVVNYDDPIIVLEAIKAGRIDFAMDMVASLVGIYMSGEPVVAIAETNWSHGGDKIIVRKGDRLANHVGDNLGVFLLQPSCLYFLDQYLQQVGLTLSDFRIVEVNARDLSAQFIAGRLPAIVNYEPWVSEAINRGNGRVLATSADFKGCIPECLWGYRKALAAIPCRDIDRLLLGWIMSVRWLKNPEHREAYYRILRKYTFKGEPGLTDADFDRMLSEVSIHDRETFLERNRPGGGLDRFLISLRRFLVRNNMLTKDFTPGDICDHRHVMHALGPSAGGTE